MMGLAAEWNENNQWDWGENGNNIWLSLVARTGMGMKHWEREGVGWKKYSRSSLILLTVWAQERTLLPREKAQVMKSPASVKQIVFVSEWDYANNLRAILVKPFRIMRTVLGLKIG